VNGCAARTGLVTTAVVSALMFAGAGVVSAYTDPTVEVGRGRIQVTAAPSADLDYCLAYYWDNETSTWVPDSPHFGGPGQPESFLFTNVPPGETTVRVRCLSGMWKTPSYFVTVAEPNPLLDFIDTFLIQIGLGALASDPTL